MEIDSCLSCFVHVVQLDWRVQILINRVAKLKCRRIMRYATTIFIGTIMRRYQFNPRFCFFLMHHSQVFSWRISSNTNGFNLLISRFRSEKCKCKTLKSHCRERLLKKEKTFGFSYFTFFFLNRMSGL